MQFLVGLGQVLADDLGLGKQGHEVHVSEPARHDVDVNVPGNSGAGDPAKVGADVEPLGLQLSPQDAERPLY